MGGGELITFYDAFHGVGGFRYGLEQAGMKCIGGCEIDKYACKAYGVINNEQCEPTDIRTVDPVRLPNFDVFVGGFPCQDLSVAGKRKGFDGERSVLFFEILRICEIKRPKYILLENVTGLFSHNNGDTFRIVLESLDELGYDAEWQMHNSAAYVPQNRERVFIIGHLRGRSTRTIFPFGAENSKTVEVVGRVDINADDYCKRVYSTDGISPCLPTMQGGSQEPKVLVNVRHDEMQEQNIVNCIDANYHKGFDNHGQRTGVMCLSDSGPGRSIQDRTGKPTPPLRAQGGGNQPGIWVSEHMSITAQDKHGVAILRSVRTDYGKQVRKQYESGELMESRHNMTELEPRTDRISNTLTSVQKDNLLYTGYRIRKLTPLECFRLQSFPDWWYYKLKEHGISDSQLYKMAGNAVTSIVAYEIGKRLVEAEGQLQLSM